jgi:uncharacterized protein (TIGR02271 family)
MNERSQLREGMTVYSSDAQRLGKVVQCSPATFVIEKGFFFKKDYLARYEDISRISQDEAWLRVNARDIVEGGAVASQDAYVGQDAYAGQDASARLDADAELGGRAAPAEDTLRTGMPPVQSLRETVASGENQEARIPLAEEELVAEKKVRQAGEVRVRKEVVEEQKQVSVPVMREEVVVERTAADRTPASGDAPIFQEAEVAIPVMEEEVEVRKRPVVREEVRVGKEVHQEQRTASATVRREDVDVERDVDRDPAARIARKPDDDPDTRR